MNTHKLAGAVFAVTLILIIAASSASKSAAWSLSGIGGSKARLVLRKALAVEKEQYVRERIIYVLR